MQEDKKLEKLRVGIILLFIFACIPITLLYLFIRDISSISSFLNNYIGTGNSLFIPFFPNLNLFWYLPEPFNVIQFSLGHLIDIFILINIIGYFQTIIYHYIKRVYLNESTPFLYSNLWTLESINFCSEEQLSLLTQDPENQFVESLLNNHDFNINSKIFNLLNKKSHYNKLFKDKIYDRKLLLILNYQNKSSENPVIILFLKVFRIFNLMITLKNSQNLILTNISNGRGDRTAYLRKPDFKISLLKQLLKIRYVNQIFLSEQGKCVR